VRSNFRGKLIALIRRTPAHPQWLLGGKGGAARWIAGHATGRVLDIGCADRWVEKCLPADGDYVGLDYPPTGQVMYGASPHIFADASRLPLVDESFDTVVILEVLEHLRAPQAALGEIARILRPQGRLLLSMPFLYPIHDSPHDYQRLTVHGLARDVEEAGLKVDVLTPVLGSAETAGLIACLAVGGMTLRAFRTHSPAVVFAPLSLVAIVVINLGAWALGRLLPSWDAITVGYRLAASKAPSSAGPGKS